jgi:hypothetical protein
VLTVHRQQRAAAALSCSEGEIAGGDEALLVRERERHAALERPHRRGKAREAERGVENDIGLGPLEQSGRVTAGLCERRQSVDRRRATGCRDELELGACGDHPERLAADRSCCTHERDPRHGHSVPAPVPFGDVSKPPLEPYPPDLPEDPQEPDLEASLTDLVVQDADWANRRVARLSVLRVELHTVRLTGADFAESTFRDVRFVGCRLDLAAARLSTFERVVFSDCRMEEVDLYGSQLNDVLFERCVLREATFSELKSQRVELRGCDLTALRGAEALRGMRMPWNDVLENAPLFAAVAGVEILD